MRLCKHRAAVLMAGLCMAALSLAAPVQAQAQGQTSASSEPQAADPFVPASASTRGTVTVRGRILPYVAEASETLLRDPQGRARATLSAVSYVGEAVGPRPETYLLNGGPGGDTISPPAGPGPRAP